MTLRNLSLPGWLLAPVLACFLPVAHADNGKENVGFSMKVMDAFKISGKGVVLTGKVESGTVQVGDSVCLITDKAGQRTLSVDAIELKRNMVNKARAGDMPGILVKGIDRKDITVNGTDRLTAHCSD